jgi:hypothetical protein
VAMSLASKFIYATDPFEALPRVILHQWGPSRARPSILMKNLDELEDRLDGIDGLYLFLDKSSFAVMSRKPLDREELRAELLPVRNTKPNRLKHNFAIVYNDRPADLFDDWSIPIANWRAFAAECRDAGLVGIAFDNEEYFGAWADFPNDCTYKQKSLNEYRAQALQRGEEVMKAICDAFPTAVVTTFHGPTLAASGGPEIVYCRPDQNELWGSFFTGMLEGCGDSALLCDGGELYALRSDDEFRSAYQWRKHNIASPEAAVAFIPLESRHRWNRVSISWGLYDCEDGETGRTTDPKTFQSTLATAVKHCDHFVWIYLEEQNLLADGPSGDWHKAIANGKSDGLAGRKVEQRN